MQRPFDQLSNDNTLFCTNQCNNHCVMCSQPPSREDDIERLYAENLQRLHVAPKDLPILGITGGEPTLMGERLIDLVRSVRKELPNTDLHILSNGRRFNDHSYTQSLVEAGEGCIIFGIPLHADYGRDHDAIAGCKGAFEETMVGLYNLAACGACIELRVVMNRMNYLRFPQIAEFIHKNLPFVTWTAFMGMERTGFAATNAKHIWVEPLEYISQLEKAVRILDEWQYQVCIYNLPLCLLPEHLRPFAQQSISEWKNTFHECCSDCLLRDRCCGSFSTSIQPYQGLHKI